MVDLAAGTSILLAAAAGQYGNAAIIGGPWRPARIGFVEWLAVALDLGVPLLPLIEVGRDRCACGRSALP